MLLRTSDGVFAEPGRSASRPEHAQQQLVARRDRESVHPLDARFCGSTLVKPSGS